MMKPDQPESLEEIPLSYGQNPSHIPMQHLTMWNLKDLKFF